MQSLHFIYIGGLNEHFKMCTCVLNYMEKFKEKKELIFKNYIVMFTHVFEGLKYLHSEKIIHGDVKGYNAVITVVTYYLV